MSGDKSAADGPGLRPHVAQHRKTCCRGSPRFEQHRSILTTLLRGSACSEQPEAQHRPGCCSVEGSGKPTAVGGRSEVSPPSAEGTAAWLRRRRLPQRQHHTVFTADQQANTKKSGPLQRVTNMMQGEGFPDCTKFILNIATQNKNKGDNET